DPLLQAEMRLDHELGHRGPPGASRWRQARRLATEPPAATIAGRGCKAMAKRVVTRKRGETAPPPPPSRLRIMLAPVADFVIRHRIRLGATVAVLLGVVILYDNLTPTIREVPPDPAAPLT